MFGARFRVRKIPCVVTVHHALVSSSLSLCLRCLSPFTLWIPSLPPPEASKMIIRFCALETHLDICQTT